MALPTSHNVVTAAQLGSTLSAYNTKLNERFKPKQTAVDDPTASGTTTTAIASISQDANGVITVTKKTISGVAPAGHTHGNITNDGKVGSTADYAVVTTTGGAVTATSLAVSSPSASGNALSFIDSVSQASNGKITATKKSVTVDSTYSATGTNPVNGTAIAAAIGTLDVSAIAGSASKTLTSISETDGKISATYSNIAISESQVTNLTTDLSAKAPLASPALTGTPTAPTANAGTNTTQIATTAFVKAEIDSVLDAADAMQFKGTIGSSGATVTALPDTHKAGWTYKVATAGTYAGKTCEVGDMIICVKDGTTASNDDWTVVQNNIDGAVTGPASSVDARIAVFNGTTGKVIKDSGYTTSSFASSSHNHDSVYFKSSGNVTLVSGSATKIGTQNGTDVKLTLPTIPAAASNGALKIGLNGGTAASKFTANQSTDSTLTFAEGATNGTIAVDGTDVAVHGLGTAAYTASSAYATSGHTHTASIAADSSSGTVVSLSANTQYKLTAGGSSVLFKTPANPTVNNAALKIQINGGTATSKFTANASSDATLTFATGSSNGTIAVDGTNVSVKGLGTAAYTESTAYATSGHTHDIALATDSGTASVTLAHNTTYKLTAGGKSVIFKTPTDTDTKVTQTLVASDNTSEYPILLAPTGQTATATTTSNFVTGAKYKPSTNTLTVNVSGSSASCSGNAATASAAKSGSALETAINGKVSTSTTVNGHALSGNVTVTAADVSAVRYDTASQGLSDTQKSNARTNIGAGTSNLAIGTTATTAAAGNHTHTTSIATSTGTSSIELVPGGKYSISAGGTSYIFQNGTEMTDDEVTDLLAALT